MAIGNVCAMGDLNLIDDPEDINTVYGVKYALVIEFKNEDECRQAIKNLNCGFTIFDQESLGREGE